ncbi:hypothetical protein HZ326_8007 [Fusarium oxysporum f. sp. albedinis]|nr:hypothetical protein HZ326_8007 [Fusarium oxysporum f. sp. albedinis]
MACAESCPSSLIMRLRAGQCLEARHRISTVLPSPLADHSLRLWSRDMYLTSRCTLVTLDSGWACELQTCLWADPTQGICFTTWLAITAWHRGRTYTMVKPMAE